MAKNNIPVSESDTQNAAAVNETAADAVQETPAPTTPDQDPAPPARARYEGVTAFVYIGPSLPDGRLKNNTILSGTYEQVTGYYADAIGAYPSVARLIVPVARLAESREKTQTSGNVMHKYYQDVTAAIKAKGVEQ
jgi:hypothetical protein